jgi:RNA polymerase sigma-70 factor (ECF subfamily)
VRIPDPDQLGDRLDEVLAVIYLVFNEGYLASARRTPARRDLAAQAVALNRVLHRLMQRELEVLGLLALLLLLLLHESRSASCPRLSCGRKAGPAGRRSWPKR